MIQVQSSLLQSKIGKLISCSEKENCRLIERKKWWGKKEGKKEREERVP